MSLRDTRAANALPDNASLGAYREGAALLQARRKNGGHMSFPDHASYLRYQRGRAQVQLRQQFRAAAPAPIPSGDKIRSKNNITDGGFTIGRTVTKDMENEDYTYEFDPSGYQTTFFPGMAEFIPANIVQGDKSSGDTLNASYWNDLGNDVFDDWGFFYIYDVTSGKYYFPILSPQNEADGVITTQTFVAFGRTFTIKHGWAVQGIFKFDISVSDNLPFRFGAYGNMGSDGDEFTEDLTQAYTIGTSSLTLYYRNDQEDGDNRERLYSYFIPKKVVENNAQTYSVYYDDDDMNMMSKEVTSGLLLYFSKSNDVKEWVINDLELDS